MKLLTLILAALPALSFAQADSIGSGLTGAGVLNCQFTVDPTLTY